MLEFSFFIDEVITLTLCLVEMKEIRKKEQKRKIKIKRNIMEKSGSVDEKSTRGKIKVRNK